MWHSMLESCWPWYTDRGPMGLGQNNSLGEYCDPHTASSVFLICDPSPPNEALVADSEIDVLE